MSTSEDQITAWFARQSRLAGGDFPIGIGDDMAEVRLGDGSSVLITTDMLLDGVHFDLRTATLKQVGYKAMAVSLSDCAAMATVPVAAVVAVALPKGFGQKKLKQLHSGITKAGAKYNCELIGGDITVWKGREKLAVSAAMLSKPSSAKPVRRDGAKVGDAICVTGSLGGSGVGRHLKFEPRVEEAIKIATTVKINSMIDISDGLSSDLGRICRQSKVGAVIDARQLPISSAAKQSKDPLGAALNDGEDFELLFTVSQRGLNKFLRGWDEKLKITSIGEITRDRSLKIKKTDGKLGELWAKGYEHLSD